MHTIETCRRAKHASKQLIKARIKHASSLNMSPTVAKYSSNTQPNKILLGQAEESHTEDQMLQISAAMDGLRMEIEIREARAPGTRERRRQKCLVGREKEWGGRRGSGGPWGPHTGAGRAPGQAAPDPGVATLWVPLAHARYLSASFYAEKFNMNFLEFFEKLHKMAKSKIQTTTLAQKNDFQDQKQT